MENSWDLQAVVRGGCNGNREGFANTNGMEFCQSSYVGFAPLTIEEEDDDIFRSFPELFDTATALDELEALYKPFYPNLEQPICPIIATPSASETQEPTKKPKSSKESSPSFKKSRKNQSKRVVKEVKEKDLFSDVWAWRKYGQKPIKGSPYPRSYYRCSSSKGCSARKQVERSNSNPELFIITFTAEHNHDHPTRRNSLAGSTRTKFPKSQNKEKTSKPALVHVKQEEEEVRHLEEDEVSQESVTDMMMGDEAGAPCFEDLGRRLEELDEFMAEPVIMTDDLFSDQYFSDSYFPSSWFAGHSSNTVTGAC